MPQDAKVQLAGLYTNASAIAGSPPGSLYQCMNVDISKDNVAQTRRGFERLAAFPDASYRATRVFDYQEYIYAYMNSTLYNYVSGSWVSRGALTKPTNALVPRQIAANNNLYILSSDGLKKTDVYTTSIFSAGLPAPIAATVTASNGTGTAVASGNIVNYRSIIVKKDANNNLVQGPVSSGMKFTASGATRDVGYRLYLPSGLAGTESVQTYRSKGLASVSDELLQVYEYSLNAANVAASAKTFGTSDVNTGTDVITSTAHGFQDGTVVQFTTTGGLPAGISASTDYVIDSATTNTFKIKALNGVTVDITTVGSGTHTATSQIGFAFFDIVPDALRGAALYTNPSQNGIGQNNIQPPLASDLEVYRDFAFYADVQTKQSFTFTIISVSGTGLVVGNTITIGSEVYTAAAAAVYGSGSGSFVIDTSSGSVATWVDITARSLVDVINRSSLLYNATLIYTDESSLPGRIRIEAKTLSGAAFTVVSNKSNAFSPILPATATALTTSTADTFRNGLMFSRQGLPEAVPSLNVFRVGSADDPIIRVKALRDALLIFKQRDGAYVLRGDNPGNFTLQVLDSTAKLVAAESLVVVNGLAYGLFEAGICAVSDTSVEVISDGIKDKLQDVFGNALSQVQDYSFGVSYEEDNKYILAIPLADTDTSAVYQIVYDISNGKFSEWNINCRAGYVSSINKKLYLANGDSHYIRQELKTFTNTDLADYAGLKTISSYSGLVLTILTGIDDFDIGDLVSQTGSATGNFASGDVNAGTDTITLASHGFQNDMTVTFTTTGTLPGGLSTGTNYLIANATTNTFTLTDETGIAIDLTSGGSGTHTASVELLAADAYVTAVDYSASTITVDFSRPWFTGVNTVDHYQGIEAVIEWAPIFGDNPAGLKHYQEVTFLFKQPIVRDADIDFNSDIASSVQTVTISGDAASSAWGVGSWGEMPWGGESVPVPVRVGVPRETARCNQLTVIFRHKVAQSEWQIQGLVPLYSPTSTRVTNG